MSMFLYSRRNPRRMLPVFLCAFLALCMLTLLQTLTGTILHEKEAFISAYQRISTTTRSPKVSEDVVSTKFILARISSLPVKLIFGTGEALLIEIERQNLRGLLELLGATSWENNDATVLAHQQIARAASKTGAWQRITHDFNTQTFATGPMVAIRLLEQPLTTTSGIIPAESASPGDPYIESYTTKEEKVRRETAFISTISNLLVMTMFTIMLLTVGGLTWSICRSRRSELAMLLVVGYPGNILVFNLMVEYGAVITTGSVLGVCVGWTGGIAMTSMLSPTGAHIYWPSEVVMLMLVFLSVMLMTAIVTVWQVFRSLDPISVIGKAEDLTS